MSSIARYSIHVSAETDTVSIAKLWQNKYVSRGTTDLSSRQRERRTLRNPQLSDSNKNLVVSPRWVLSYKTDWPTDHRS
jgi:hypothetical protein